MLLPSLPFRLMKRGFNGSDDVDCDFLGCGVMWSCSHIENNDTFARNDGNHPQDSTASQPAVTFLFTFQNQGCPSNEILKHSRNIEGTILQTQEKPGVYFDARIRLNAVECDSDLKNSKQRYQMRISRRLHFCLAKPRR
jgi:hypothetical protein